MKFPWQNKKEPENSSGKYKDGISSLTNSLANSRNASATNIFEHDKLDYSELWSIFKTGLYSKICHMKVGDALQDPFVFETEEQEEYYKEYIEEGLKEACLYMLGFGRGIVVIVEKGADLSTPAPDILKREKIMLRTFDAGMVSVTDYSYDLMSEYYYAPRMYTVRGHNIHASRVIDFTYHKPIEDELPEYNFGGIPEPELIYNQLMNDAVVQRAAGGVAEKLSSIFYKLNGFFESLQSKQEAHVVRYMRTTENQRSVFGAGIIDGKDDVISVQQPITGFKDIDESALRRVAMVSGVPMPMLIGENVKGLNSAGDTERETYQRTLVRLRDEFIIRKANVLFERIGLDPVTAKESSGLSATEQINYDDKAATVAVKLRDMGEDHHSYLVDKGIVKDDITEEIFPESEELETQAVDPSESLNGAQVTSMLSIIGQVTSGVLPKSSAAKIFATAFPMTEEQAFAVLADVEEGSIPEGGE